MTTEIERQESAAKKVVDLMLGGLKGATRFEAIELPGGEVVLAVCFPASLWEFDGRNFIRKQVQVMEPQIGQTERTEPAEQSIYRKGRGYKFVRK